MEQHEPRIIHPPDKQASLMALKQNERIRILYSLGDFQIALSAADFLSECDYQGQYSIVELRRFRCYETTLIVSYARPFSQTFSKIPRFGFNMIGMNLDAHQSSLHDELLRLRNKVYAHSDSEMMQMVSRTFPVGHHATQIPDVQFDEGIRFLGNKLDDVIIHLRKIRTRIVERIYDDAQLNPDKFNIKLL